MIKRLGKTKKSKQGAILVVVVLILALAMIFIASALMLTQATRNRLYGNAMSSQARLTVTAASEVFWEAVDMQEITDAQIDALLKESPKGTNPDNSHTDDEKIKMVISNMPGMTTDPDNCTLLDIYYPDYPDKETVYCDFKTTIGDQVENIRLILGVSEGHTSNGGRFKNQIDIGSGTTSTQLRYTNGVGMLNPANERPTDNTILVRGSSSDTTSDAVFYSDLVFASGGTAVFGADSNVYHGDMIFLAGSVFDTDVLPHIYGDFYFLGDDTDEGAFEVHDIDGWSQNANQKGQIQSTNFVFSGRLATNYTDGVEDTDGKRVVKLLLEHADSNCYFLDADGDLITATNTDRRGDYTIDNASDSLPTNLSDRLELYKAYRYNSTDPFPVDVLTDVFCEINPDGLTKKITAGTELTRDEYEIKYDEDQGRDIATFYAKGSILDHDIDAVKNPLTTKYPDYKKDINGTIPTAFEMTEAQLYSKCSSGFWEMPAGYYRIKPGKTVDNSSSDPNVICIDGNSAGEYRIYFASGDHYINNLVFAVYNVAATDPSPVVFILEPGAKLYFSSNANSKDVDALCSAGFISVNRSCTSASAIANLIRTTGRSKLVANGGDEQVWDTEHKTTHNAQITYSKYYDGVNKPCIFVYGTGGNLFKVGSGDTFEAYIGLYGNSSFEKGDFMSDNIYIYGRIEANTFGGPNNAVGGFCMPYCPSPNTISGEEEFKVAKTKYHVANVAYYY